MKGETELKVKTSLTDTLGGQTAVRWAGRAGLFVKGGVFKHDLIEKMLGTGQNRSFNRGVRPARVFVRRGSTVYHSLISRWISGPVQGKNLFHFTFTQFSCCFI